jgi:hypothetical protein
VSLGILLLYPFCVLSLGLGLGADCIPSLLLILSAGRRAAGHIWFGFGGWWCFFAFDFFFFLVCMHLWESQNWMDG